MSGGQELRTVVADTSALVSLAIPRTDADDERETNLDPLRWLLTSCSVAVPEAVVDELHDVATHSDVHGSAATAVLAAREHYAVEQPYAVDGPSRPAFDLDDGETDAIVLANSLGVDGLVTDEFGGTNFALIHAVLEGPRLVTTPRLVCDYARNGHVSHADARDAIREIGRHRSWEGSRYVAQLLALLE